MYYRKCLYRNVALLESQYKLVTDKYYDALFSIKKQQMLVQYFGISTNTLTIYFSLVNISFMNHFVTFTNNFMHVFFFLIQF